MKGAGWLLASGTIAGLVAVLAYHSEAMPATTLNGSAPVSQGPSPSPSATEGGANTGAAKTGAAKTGAAKAGPSAAAATGTATGPNEQFGYGELTVRVTVQGGRITSVTVPSLQTAEPRSQQISEQAIPTLTSEVISAQSLSINAVSGATYTSDAYAQSLQAALDKLHFRS